MAVVASSGVNAGNNGGSSGGGGSGTCEKFRH